MMGIDYHFNAPDGSPILYEFRKDLSAYVELVFILFLVQWLVARYAAPPAASSERRTLAIGDGSVTHHLPIDEIEHVAAAGNYVAIAWRGERLPHRATLNAAEVDLCHAFARIHPTRLSCPPALRRAATPTRADPPLEMDTGG